MYGSCISMLCSSSSVDMLISSNSPVAYNSLYTVKTPPAASHVDYSLQLHCFDNSTNSWYHIKLMLDRFIAEICLFVLLLEWSMIQWKFFNSVTSSLHTSESVLSHAGNVYECEADCWTLTGYLQVSIFRRGWVTLSANFRWTGICLLYTSPSPRD